MSVKHPIHFAVEVSRNHFVMHTHVVQTRAEADAIVKKFEDEPHVDVTVVEVHEPEEADLTTHTRELVEDLQETSSDPSIG